MSDVTESPIGSPTDSHQNHGARDDLLTVFLDELEISSEMTAPTQGAIAGSQRDDGEIEVEGEDRGQNEEREEDESEEIDPTPLEYGRANGLMRDYLVEKYREIKELRSAVIPNSIDDSHLPQFNLGNAFKLEERMSLSKYGAALLASIAHEETSATMDALIAPMLETKRSVGRMKMELPLLRSENGTDCKNFARREGFEVRLRDIKLPLEAVHEESGEGLVWPSRFWDIGPQLLEDLKKEKIAISKDTLAYLSNAVTVYWTEIDIQTLWDSEVNYKRNPALEPVTPPLSPVYAKWEPFVPSSTDSAFDVPILSDPVSPTKRELEELEEKMFKEGIPTPLRNRGTVESPSSASSNTYAGDEPVKLGDFYSPLASLDNSDPPPIPEGQRVRRQDLKVEEPITPEGPPISLPKTVRFNEIVPELTIDSPQSRLNSPEFDSKFFEEAFGAAGETVNQKIEQEKLIEADATARVDVPLMDFSKADPPWTKFEGQKKSSLLLMQVSFIQETIGTAQIWPGRRKGDLKLRWLPWEKDQANVVVDEQMEADPGVLEAVLNSPSDQEVIDSSSLTWKPTGLMILRDDDDDDDEIAPGQFEIGTPLDLTSLVKKRKLELQERAAIENEARASKRFVTGANAILVSQTSNPKLPATNANAVSVAHSLQKLSAKNGFMSAAGKLAIDSNEPNFGMLLGGTFSAQNSLDNYLEIRGNKKVKLTESSYFGGKVTKLLNNPLPVQEKHPLPKQKPPVVEAGTLPAPSVPAQTTRSSVIIASTLIKRRTLVKHITKLLPSLELVERDFSAHNTTAWMSGSVTRSPIISPLAAEADLIVSASTGIIVTSLQKIKQKLLPGQKGKPAIRSRVEQASLRYEKLVVFVSEGRQDESTNGLDESDCITFSEFIGFTLGLDISVSVQFVAGGEETLAKWIASRVIQNLMSDSPELLPDETLWELFLRRAGMNAYAAQVAIESLKAPEGVDPSSPAKAGQFGLSAFVEMGHEDRVARFGRFCGRKLLERVSAAVDGKWEL